MKLFPLFTGLAFFASVQLSDQFSLRADPDPNLPDGIVAALPPTSPDAASLPPTIVMVGYPSEEEEGGDGDGDLVLDSPVEETTDGGKSDKLVGLQPDDVVGVVVDYGMDKVGQRIEGVALNGGEITAPDGLFVGESGQLSFKFQVGHDPGFYQIALREAVGKDCSQGGGSEIGVHFWVLDTQSPDDNPRVTLPGEDTEEGE
jgi:hypothetical protein